MSARQKGGIKSGGSHPATSEKKSRYRQPPKRAGSTAKAPPPVPVLHEASVFFVDSFFRKERVREVYSSGFVLSPQGEAFIYRNELKRGRPYRQWLLFRTEDSSYYVVDPLAETAVRTPKIIFSQSLLAPDKNVCKGNVPPHSPVDSLVDENKILGYATQKCIRRNADGSKVEQWVVPELTFPLNQRPRMAAALNKFQLPDKPEYGEHAGCFVFRERKYDSTGKLIYSRTLSRFEPDYAEKRFFDLQGFGITDILTGWVVKDPEPDSTAKKK